MPQGYKQQVSELRDALTVSNAELAVCKTELRDTKTALSSVYRATSAVWLQLSRIDTLSEHIKGEVGFLDHPTLVGQNTEVMTDHILCALGQIATGAGDAALTLRGVQYELSLSEEVIQNHKDAVEVYSTADLKSPLAHLTSALDQLDKEDQKLRVQIAQSEARRYESYKATVDLLEAGRPKDDARDESEKAGTDQALVSTSDQDTMNLKAESTTESKVIKPATSSKPQVRGFTKPKKK